MPHTHDTFAADASARDLAALQGTWEQVDFEENGVANPPDIHGAPGAITVIRGQHFEVRTIEGGLLLEGSFEI
ncbi:MAG: TIGR03067 domain-containing protein, partial [Rhodanobacter sp.]